jgi:AmmeMemoRadiSam system protein A
MHPLILLAKQAVENYIENKEILKVPQGLTREFLDRKAGVFVTIEKSGQLRGCIGTYLPTRDSIAEETIHNAISAAVDDNRFGPVKKAELSQLKYTVSILSSPQPVKDISELNPKIYGVILKAGQKSGLLLPNLEGVYTVSEQIAICCQKAGIYLKEDNAQIYKFTVEKFN